ncbi:MAG: glycosyltransferase [Methanobacteriaceae archaeon]|nr:glycosyltransferase [Methanobacteriaceae archaeon]
MNFEKYKETHVSPKANRNKLIEKESTKKSKNMSKNEISIINKLRSLKNKISLRENSDLIILDDLFPHPLSAFRLQEFNSYLNYFKKTKIYTRPLSFPAIKEKRSLESIIKDYEKKYPRFKGKVKKFYPRKILIGKIAYMIFLNNTYSYIDILEKYKIPFLFTLYPGGGFQLYQEVSNKKLKRIFSSPCFRKVITTQKITYDYLIDNNFCQPNDVVKIFGIVTPLNLLNKEFEDKEFYGRGRKNLNICFVAHRYSEKGVDKGYDIFIKVAQLLAKKYDNIYFFVVGNFDENIIDVKSIKHRIKFYGSREHEWFEKFYKDKDIILSPNIPFNLMEGSFDGFPTGSCTEASLHQVAIFCTDELGLNTKFSKDEIVIIPHNVKEIVKIIEKYYHDPIKLEKIARKGCKKVKEIYSYKNQIEPRINILKELIRDH